MQKIEKIIWSAIALVSLSAIVGCIADSPEDSDLPWASNKGWEGVAPIRGVMDRYE